MISTVTSNGHTVVPKKLRGRFDLRPGTTLEWQAGTGLPHGGFSPSAF
jgi:AbrB family looped-hinge helix DNA binding protein